LIKIERLTLDAEKEHNFDSALLNFAILQSEGGDLGQDRPTLIPNCSQPEEVSIELLLFSYLLDLSSI